MSYYVPSTPSRHRPRSYSLSQPTQMAGSSYPYPTTPYSGYNTLAPTYYDPGYNSSQTYYVAPSVSGRSRSRSRSRPGHGHRSHGHGRSQHRSRSRHRQHVPQRRSHSTASHRHQRPHNVSHRPPQTRITYPRQSHHSPSIGARILSFFGLGHSNRYVDQHGRTSNNRGRTLHKY